MNKIILIIPLLLALAVQAQTFTNPLKDSGPDPYNFYKDGYYYYTNTTGTNVTLWKTRSLADLRNAEKKVIWKAPATGMYSKQVWAPEVIFLQGKWYAYFTADDGDNDNHRMYALENSSSDPMEGTWIFKGKVADAADKWAIDADIIDYKGQLYMAWSGWEGDKNGRQDVYIAKMKNPWTIDGRRVRIAGPDFDWEKHGDLKEPGVNHLDVNEGPQFLVHRKKIFIVYSASACWTDNYSLGLLYTDAKANLLDPTSWKKLSKPVFETSVENSVYAPGHNSFFKSPDGREDWILYHANSKAGQGCGNVRSPRAQKFSWDKNDMPVFGKPIKEGDSLAVPR